MNRPPLFAALRITGIYTLLGVLWIIASDRLLELTVPDLHALTVIQTYKGWVFVLASGLLIFLVLHRELRARVSAEDTLRASEERLQKVFEQGPLGMAILDLDYRWVSVNPRLCEMLGYTQDELTKLTFVDITHPDDIEPDLEQSKKLLSAEIPLYKMEKRYIKKGGEVLWILLTGSVVRDDQGTPLYFFAMIEDITQRKTMEQALSRSESLLRNILSTSPVGIVGLTADRSIAWVNEACLEMFGFESEEEVVGRSAAIVYPSDAEYDRVGKILYEGLKTGQTTSIDATLKRKDGSLFAGLIRMKALGEPDLAIAAISDISERRRAEELLKESEARTRTKLDSILLPEGDIGTLELEDVVDVPTFQALMDDFFSLSKLPVGLIDLKGKILVATGWQEICTKFHRAHPETCQYCIESDTVLSGRAEPGTFKLYRCKNNLWDVATPIIVGGNHIGNLFLGQFLFEYEEPDYDTFRSQASRYGFDEHEYLLALEKVPRWTRETVDLAMAFYAKLANMLSALSYSNIKLARSLAEQKLLLNTLRESEQRYRAVVDNIEIGISVLNPDMQVVEIN
ncbi:MAG: PAS domain S-box protein, partial [Thaumarchaeota archaeon]|nr:PAS domain S-box protein [Nitrososphaerota archaeon]